MGQEVGWVFIKPEQKKEQGWTFSAPTAAPLPPPKPEPEKKRKTEPFLKTAKDVAIGIPEAVVSAVSGVGGFLGGLVAQGSEAIPRIMAGENVLEAFGKGRETKEKVASALTHEPTTRFAQAATTVAAAPFEVALEGVDWAAKKATKDPDRQAGIRFVAEVILARGIKPGVGYIKRVISAKKPLRIETMIKFVEENAPPEVIAEMKKGLSDKYSPKGPEVASHAGQAGWSTEALNRGKTRKFSIYDTRTGKETPLIGVDAIDIQPKQGQVKYQVNSVTGKKEIVDVGPNTKAPQEGFTFSQPPLQEGAVRGGSMLPTTELPKRVGPINLERLDLGEPVQKIVADMEDALHKSRVESGRQKVTWNESEEIANSMGGAYEIGQVIGKSAEEVIADAKKSTKFLAEKIEATRTLFKTSILDAQKKAKAYMDDPTPANEAAAQMAYNRWALIQYETGQASGEVGRALNIHKKLARSKDMILTQNYAKMLKQLGHDKMTPEVMELLASMDESNPLPAMKFLAQARKATTHEKLFEIWINSLLSNPQTHVVNFTSNMVFEAMAPFDKAAGAMVEFARHPLIPSKREMYFGEALHSVVGAFHGVREGLNRYVHAMKHGVTESGVSKFETPRKSIKGVTGEIVRIPTKELMAADDFMKAIIYSDEIYALAYRKATQEGLRGVARKAKMAELIASPPEEMTNAAIKMSKTRTFQAELGKLGKDFMRLRSRSPVLEFVFPFVRTPVNVVKEGLKYTPLGVIGMKDLTRAEKSTRIGKAYIGTVVAALLAKAVAEGNITGGGPTDQAERQTWFQTGAKPYSIKIGDNYYSYGRLEPVATALGTMADYHEIYQRAGRDAWTKIAAKIGTAIRNNVSNKTFLTGMTDIINATTDPGRYGEQVIKRMATSAVPGSGLWGGLARTIDPEFKEARTIIDWYKARLPGLSKQVPGKINVFGEKQKMGGSALSRLLSPVAVSPVSKDPVYVELARLGLNLAQQHPMVGGKPMSKEDTRRLTESAGPEVKKKIAEIMAFPMYKMLSDENKKKLLKSQITKIRGLQKNIFILEETK